MKRRRQSNVNSVEVRVSQAGAFVLCRGNEGGGGSVRRCPNCLNVAGNLGRRLSSSYRSLQLERRPTPSRCRRTPKA